MISVSFLGAFVSAHLLLMFIHTTLYECLSLTSALTLLEFLFSTILEHCGKLHRSVFFTIGYINHQFVPDYEGVFVGGCGIGRCVGVDWEFVCENLFSEKGADRVCPVVRVYDAVAGAWRLFWFWYSGGCELV